jgi:sec-independent protein translocase protein TatA
MKEIAMLAELFSEQGIIVIVVVAVLLFGGAAIPKLARSLGSAKSEFEKGSKTAGDTPSEQATEATGASTNGAGNTTAKTADDKPATSG